MNSMNATATATKTPAAKIVRNTVGGFTIIENNIPFEYATIAEAIDVLRSAKVQGVSVAEYYHGDDEQYGCECEQDWNCPMHGGTNSPTWLESRYSHEEEDRY